MKKVLMTHYSREIDETHTSWSEIFAFKRFIQSKNTIVECLSKEMISSDVLKCYDKLIIFKSGKSIDENFHRLLIESDIELYLVFQDPNWGLNFEIDRDYYLITPFKRLSRLTSYKSVLAELKEVLGDSINLSKFKKHYYLPFGLMSLFDSYYDENQRYIDIDKTSNIVYLGSNKKDRYSLFDKMSKNNIDVYGNFSDIESLLKRKKFNDNHFNLKGRIPAECVSYVASQYEEVAYAPDKKMIMLDVCHRRQTETLNSNIRIYANHSELYTILDKTCDKLSKDIYRFSKKKLISHYGKFTKSIVGKILNLDKETMTLGDFEMLSKRVLLVDNSTKSLIDVKPLSVEFNADLSLLKCNYDIEFDIKFDRSLSDFVVNVEFDLPIEIESLTLARPFKFDTIINLSDIDLNSNELMKVNSVAKRIISTVIDQQVERVLKSNG